MRIYPTLTIVKPTHTSPCFITDDDVVSLTPIPTVAINSTEQIAAMCEQIHKMSAIFADLYRTAREIDAWALSVADMCSLDTGRRLVHRDLIEHLTKLSREFPDEFDWCEAGGREDAECK